MRLYWMLSAHDMYTKQKIFFPIHCSCFLLLWVCLWACVWPHIVLWMENNIIISHARTHTLDQQREKKQQQRGNGNSSSTAQQNRSNSFVFSLFLFTWWLLLLSSLLFFFHYWLGVFEFVRFFSCLSLDIFTNCCHPLNIPPHTRTYTKALTFTYSFTRRHVHTQTHIAHWGTLCECVFLWISSPLVINIYILTCNCDQVLVCMLIQYIFGSIAYNFIFVSFFFEFLAIFF